MSKFQMILWPCFTIFIFGVALFFNYTASTGLVSDLDVGEVSDKYPFEITPASWTFSIWGFIYVYQAIWIIHTLILTCKYGDEMSTILFGKYFWFLYNIANLCNALWLIVFVKEWIIVAAITLPLIAFGLVASAAIAHKSLYQITADEENASPDSYGAADDSSQSSNSSDAPKWLSESASQRLWLYATVCNAIPFYATWTVVASHLNVGIALVHEGGVSQNTAAFVMLSVLLSVICVYWYCDFYRFRFALRFTYSPYIVLCVAFAGVVTNGGVDIEERPSSAYALALLVLAILGTVAKVVMGVMMRNTPDRRGSMQSV